MTQISNAIAVDIRGAALSEARAQRANTWTYVAIAIAAAAICLWFGLRDAVSLVKTMRGVRGAIQKIERGDAEVEVPGGARRDDLGDIARALDTIRDQGAGMARVRAALDRTQTALLVLDQDGKPLYDNAAFRKLSGATELVGQEDASGLLASIDEGAQVRSDANAKELLSATVFSWPGAAMCSTPMATCWAL
ncbi:MAG: hypothetical protein AAF909_09640 [Pseudomonadota bacterium]